MVQPVGNVLRADAQGRAVLHQPDIMDIRHLGAADTLIDPTHHIAQYALAVVVEFLLDVPGATELGLIQLGRSATGMVSKSFSEARGREASSVCRAATST